MTFSPRAALGLAALLAGCGQPGIDPVEEQIATDGTQAMEATSQSTNLGAPIFEPVSATDPVTAAGQIIGPAEWLSACVTRAKDPSSPLVTHVTLDDCTGPFGLVHLDGEEEVTLSAGAGGALHAAITGMSLTAGGKSIVASATADITIPSATSRSVIWQGSWTRVDELGETVTFASDFQIKDDLTTRCATSSGSAVTTVAGREVDSSITGYELCRDATTGAVGCPSGTVTHTGKLSGKTVIVQFDGTDVAYVSGPSGDAFPVGLVCTPLGR